VIAKVNGDEVLAASHSSELKKFGLARFHRKCTLGISTGLLCGLRAKKAGLAKAVLDIGLITPTKGSRLFATLNGFIDAGLEVPHSEEKLVKERTNGFSHSSYAKKLGAGSESYSVKFAAQLARKLSPREASRKLFAG